jgi:hypothetical protein
MEHRAVAGAPGGEAPGAGVRPVVEFPRRIEDALRRLLTSVAIEGAAHGGLRQAQLVCQVLELHHGVISSGPYSKRLI